MEGTSGKNDSSQRDNTIPYNSSSLKKVARKIVAGCLARGEFWEG
jgi:hypothetical protein